MKCCSEAEKHSKSVQYRDKVSLHLNRYWYSYLPGRTVTKLSSFGFLWISV